MSGYIKKVVVFCGSSPGNDPEIIDQTETLGALLGDNGFDLIYGGGTSGLMGLVSQAALDHGASVKGIIPKIFHKAGAAEQGSLLGSEEHVVENMLIRKDQMILEADAGIALPGGYGSLDEIYEMAVTQQLKTFAAPDDKLQPLIVVNYEGYYDGQIQTLDRMVEKGFLKPEYRNLIIFVADAREAVDMLKRFNAKAPVAARDFRNFSPKP